MVLLLAEASCLAYSLLKLEAGFGYACKYRFSVHFAILRTVPATDVKPCISLLCTEYRYMSTNRGTGTSLHHGVSSEHSHVTFF